MLPPELATSGDTIWSSYAGRLWRIDAAANRAEVIRTEGVASIASGEGGLWVLTAAGTIERLDPDTNRVVDRIFRERVGFVEFGGGLAVGAGAVWTQTYLDRAIWKIDPAAGYFTGRMTLGHRPTGVAFGDGAVWIVTTDGFLLRLDARTEKLVQKLRLGVYAAQAPAGAIEAQGRWARLATGFGALWLPVTP